MRLQGLVGLPGRVSVQFHVSYVTLLQRLVTLVYVTNGQFYVTNVKNQVT